MDTTKVITLTVIGILSMSIFLTFMQLSLRKEKSKAENEGKINLAYGVLFFTWIVAFSLLNLSVLSILNEYIDTVYKINAASPLTDITKTSILFIGLTHTWLILWHFITKALSILFTGNRSAVNEIQSNHYVFFLMKGIVFVGFVYCLMPAFESLLRMFLLNIEIPYYR